MPLWTFELTPGILSDEEKRAIAEKVTALYTVHEMPAFLITVLFNEKPHNNFFSGGKSPSNTVWVIIGHAARGFHTEEERLKFHAGIKDILEPVFAPKGTKWELNIRENPIDNWRVNGMLPPIQKPEVWKQWIEKNEPVPFE